MTFAHKVMGRSGSGRDLLAGTPTPAQKGASLRPGDCSPWTEPRAPAPSTHRPTPGGYSQEASAWFRGGRAARRPQGDLGVRGDPADRGAGEPGQSAEGQSRLGQWEGPGSHGPARNTLDTGTGGCTASQPTMFQPPPNDASLWGHHKDRLLRGGVWKEGGPGGSGGAQTEAKVGLQPGAEATPWDVSRDGALGRPPLEDTPSRAVCPPGRRKARFLRTVHPGAPHPAPPTQVPLLRRTRL